MAVYNKVVMIISDKIIIALTDLHLLTITNLHLENILSIPNTNTIVEMEVTLFILKVLSQEQLTALLDNQGSVNLRWLILACEELRVFGVFETVLN